MKLLYVFYISGSLQSKHQHKYKNICFYCADQQKHNLKINNILYNWRIKNQLYVICYFIVLLIDSTCFGHYYANHQELATMVLITTLVVSLLILLLLVSGLQAQARLESFLSLEPGHNSSLTAPNFQHKANQERNDQFGNQHHSRGLLMMGIVMPETCWACKKYNKMTSGI